MASTMFLFPVQAGNIEALKAAFAEMAGSREAQCVANRAVMGVTREYACLQHTPQGDFLLAYLEGDDLDKARERSVASDSEYARWLVSTVGPLIGRQPGDGFPISEPLADWRA